MVMQAPLPPRASALPRSFESRGLHFIEHHQPLIWGLIGGVWAVVLVFYA